MKRFAVFCIMAAVMLTAFCGCSNIGGSWIISVNGNKIDKNEYMVYLYEQVKVFEETGGSDIWDIDFDGVSAPEVAKQNAANSLLRAKLAVEEAPSLGVNTSVDEASVDADAKELYESIQGDTIGRIDLSGVTLDICKNIIRDGLVQSQVYDAVTGSYEINRQEFNNYLQDSYNKNISMYKNVTVKAIYVNSDPNAAPPEGEEPAIDEFSNTIKKEISLKGKERIDKAYALLKKGEQFAAVQYDYSEDPDRREFVLSDDMYDESVRSMIYALNKGEYTDIIEYNGGYYIFYAKEVYQSDMDSVSAEMEEEYIREKKEEIYQAQNDSWVNSAEIKRNTAVWDGVTINTEGGTAAPAEEQTQAEEQPVQEAEPTEVQ